MSWFECVCCLLSNFDPILIVLASHFRAAVGTPIKTSTWDLAYQIGETKAHPAVILTDTAGIPLFTCRFARLWVLLFFFVRRRFFSPARMVKTFWAGPVFWPWLFSTAEARTSKSSPSGLFLAPKPGFKHKNRGFSAKTGFCAVFFFAQPARFLGELVFHARLEKRGNSRHAYRSPP